MKRIVAITVAIVALAGCTPGEKQVWAEWFQKEPTAAKAEYDKQFPAVKTEVALAVPANAPMGSKCPGWYDEAMDAGFEYNQWRTVDRIMWRESRCNQGVRNHSSGSTGLMQIMPMWADDCGTTVAGLRIGSVNLRCARHILRTQGWSAWT